MKLSEFEVGKTFLCGGKTWRCTDIGSRTVVAIEYDLRTDRTWFDGPPYAVMEHVFDEEDQKGCSVEGGGVERRDEDRRCSLPTRAAEWRDPDVRAKLPAEVHPLLDKLAEAFDDIERRASDRREG